MMMPSRLLCLWLSLAGLAVAQLPEPATSDSKAEQSKAEQPKAEQPKAEQPKAEQPKAEQPKAEQSEAAAGKGEASEEAAAAKAEQSGSAGQNLLGQADTGRGEGRRNENVQITLVDNNAARDSTQRVGPTATIIDEFRVERSYYSSEFGNPGRGPIHAQPQRAVGTHGNVSLNHNNSVFTARSFFQAGSVQPARQNQIGAGLSTGLWAGANFTFAGTEDINRGSVNGNILIPLPEERTVLATDPGVRKIVQSWIDAYPNVAPNRPDIAARALNINSPQSVDTTFTNGQLNQVLDGRDKLAARYGFTAQNVEAFQFTIGQNPNTNNKSHTARLTWDREWNAATTGDFSLGFDRQGVLLLPTQDAVGPVFVNGLTALGPTNTIPVNRAINQFRTGASLQTKQGRHSVGAGVASTRIQYNGDEPDGQRPVWTIREDFGNSSIQNLRLGKPYQLSQSFGDAYRAYRNWELLAFVGDHWTVNDRLTLSYGTRWEPVTKPSEIRNRSGMPFDSDWNNFGGNAGFAYRLSRSNKTAGVLRGAYGVMFGQIFPATYGQDRLNPPYFTRFNLNAPNMANPFAGYSAADLNPATLRGNRYDLSPDLATPYSFQFNASWNTELHTGWRLEVGYVGSRSIKLFQSYILNRARFVPGIPFTTATINERRPDQRVSDHFYTGNFSRAYYDAGRVSLAIPRWHGITLNTAYWYSKAIDLGGDYVTTGGGNERFGNAGQSGERVFEDMKGASGFDQPHAFMLQANYDTGRRKQGFLSKFTRNWAINGVYLLKSGTPFSITSGADGPGLGNIDGASGDRPSVVDPSVLYRTIGDPSTSDVLLPKSAFRFINAPEETVGNVPRNAFRRGPIANLNASLGRTWTMANDFQVTFRAESINLTNTPQFAEPNNSLASPAFGQITNTMNDGRTFRFLLRLAF